MQHYATCRRPSFWFPCEMPRWRDGLWMLVTRTARSQVWQVRSLQLKKEYLKLNDALRASEWPSTSTSSTSTDVCCRALLSTPRRLHVQSRHAPSSDLLRLLRKRAFLMSLIGSRAFESERGSNGVSGRSGKCVNATRASEGHPFRRLSTCTRSSDRQIIMLSRESSRYTNEGIFAAIAFCHCRQF